MNLLPIRVINLILTAGNLIPFCLLFSVFPLKGKKRPALFFLDTLRSFGEFMIYQGAILRLSALILSGIQIQEASVLLFGSLHILFAQSLILLFFLGRLFSKKTPAPAVDEDTVPILRAFELLSLIGLFLLYICLHFLFTEAPSLKRLLFLVLCLLLLAVIHSLYEKTQTAILLDKRKTALDRQKQKEADYLQNVDIQYQRTRELWHDLKNHISVLQILAQDQRFTELTSYLVSFRQDVEARMIPSKTGNAAVDALLGDKLYHAHRQDTSLTLEICPLADLKMNPTDLCSILGNLIDNALEACARLDTNRQIQLCLKEQEGFFYLKLSNTALLSEKNGPLPIGQTSKSDMDNGVGHGLGLRSVERIAHEYNGSLVTDYQDGIFTVILRWEA